MLHELSLDLAVNVLTSILRAYVAESPMDHLAGTLKKGGIKDLLIFFPPNRRTDANLDAHFRSAGLPQVADWWTRKRNALTKEDIAKAVKEALERDSDVRLCFLFCFRNSRASFSFLLFLLFPFPGADETQVVAAVRAVVEERPLPEAELVTSLWLGLMAQVDWSARPDQIEGLALREVSVRCCPPNLPNCSDN